MALKRPTPNCSSRVRRGVAAIYAIISLIALCAICSLGADYARVQLVKCELERAADAAARAAASVLPVSDSSTARNVAINVAALQSADGSPVVLKLSDVEVGTYSGGSFTANATPPNAVRVTASRLAANGNAVSLSFARVLGMTTCDAKGVSIATCTLRPFAGFIGLTGVSIKNNLFIALAFSGKATIYVNGDVVLSGTMTAFNSIPGNLVIYQLGTGRSFGSTGSNDMDVTAFIIAPGSDFSAKNNLTFRGSGFFNSIDVKNNANVYYDEALGSAKNSVTVIQVK